MELALVLVSIVLRSEFALDSKKLVLDLQSLSYLIISLGFLTQDYLNLLICFLWIELSGRLRVLFSLQPL